MTYLIPLDRAADLQHQFERFGIENKIQNLTCLEIKDLPEHTQVFFDNYCKEFQNVKKFKVEEVKIENLEEFLNDIKEENKNIIKLMEKLYSHVMALASLTLSDDEKIDLPFDENEEYEEEEEHSDDCECEFCVEDRYTEDTEDIEDLK
jgi:hypothetical protein